MIESSNRRTYRLCTRAEVTPQLGHEAFLLALVASIRRLIGRLPDPAAGPEQDRRTVRRLPHGTLPADYGISEYSGVLLLDP
jgi:hypothetical protein